MVVGSDIIYDPDLHESLLATMADLARGGDDESRAPVLLAVADWMQPDQAHSRFVRDGWLATARAMGWEWDVVQTIRGATRCVSDTTAMPVVILRGIAPARAPVV